MDEPEKIGPKSKSRVLLFISEKVSSIERSFKVTSPVFFISIVYWRISPLSFLLSPSSITLTDLDTVIDGLWIKISSVGSSRLFPSFKPSSLTSETSPLFLGLLAVARILFLTPPLSKASWLMVYEAL